MTAIESTQRWTSWLWKLPAATAAYIVGLMIGGALMAAAGIAGPRPIAGTDPTVQFLLMIPSAAVLVAALAVIATGLAGRWWERWLVLAGFVFLIDAVGNGFEAKIFTTLGGELGALVFKIPAILLCALAVSLLTSGQERTPLAELWARYRASFRLLPLAGRLAAAWVIFPFLYFLFGMMVAPFVVPHYQQLDFLTIPPMSVLLPTLFLRSALLLAASLPVIVAWRSSRRGLVLGLTAGHFVTVGFAGLIVATFLPTLLRTLHSVEILADSFLYALALVWLLAPKTTERAEERSSAAIQAASGAH